MGKRGHCHGNEARGKGKKKERRKGCMFQRTKVVDNISCIT